MKSSFRSSQFIYLTRPNKKCSQSRCDAHGRARQVQRHGPSYSAEFYLRAACCYFWFLFGHGSTESVQVVFRDCTVYGLQRMAHHVLSVSSSVFVYSDPSS